MQSDGMLAVKLFSVCRQKKKKEKNENMHLY